ncbi:dihydrofolate reductase family protein [Nocardioides sp. T2.26MG-1]|uniref:dihydrofolate reductase family protein n=1 Tax=Nocardioides sp. T2.26MG-1 TaxID=3041166 RepID=UPI0024773080|nr:dihydrofolate reductase family protein [Nocardioides sp. T2.26MG-1]CAI9403476.1 Riboflavin biosynthesis protein RibD [Nocardioides sp. T2.26MG-1]
MRVLVGPESTDLAELYAVPRTPWLRVNMVSTVDGAATGETGTSGSINNAADKQVFDQLRAMADVIVVGAGTVRAERYGPAGKPLVVVSRRGQVPDSLRDAPRGSVLLATCGTAEGLGAARDLLGAEQVLVLGSHRVDLPLLKQVLADRGWGHVLSEGGPHLLRDLLASGAADELCTTVVPRLVAGEHPRITQGPPVDVPLRLHLLLESEGTLLGRWLTDSPTGQ